MLAFACINLADPLQGRCEANVACSRVCFELLWPVRCLAYSVTCLLLAELLECEDLLRCDHEFCRLHNLMIAILVTWPWHGVGQWYMRRKWKTVCPAMVILSPLTWLLNTAGTSYPMFGINLLHLSWQSSVMSWFCCSSTLVQDLQLPYTLYWQLDVPILGEHYQQLSCHCLATQTWKARVWCGIGL